MLLAPNTRWAMANLAGSEGGKYGASTQLSEHLLLNVLHAAQGLATTTRSGRAGVGDGQDGGTGDGGGEDAEATVSEDSILWCWS